MVFYYGSSIILVFSFINLNLGYQFNREIKQEVGVKLQNGDRVRYELDSDTASTDEETIIIGFSTQIKLGILMQIRNNNPRNPEYISVEMNKNGGVKLDLDVGYGRDVVNTAIRNVDLTDGSRPHVVTVTRRNKGRVLRVAVDDYPATERRLDWLPPTADTKLDNPRFIYFGANQTTSYGFTGCLFKAQFGDIYPLKNVFQDPRPANIQVVPHSGADENYKITKCTIRK